MSIAFYTGVTGMRAFQSALDVTSHNIANVNTHGYKVRRASFDDLMRSRINTNVEGQHMVGHGVKQEYVDILQKQSSLDLTDFELDFAIVGEGYFAVEAGGERQYTRAGNFYLSVEGNNAYLVTNEGRYVLDKTGNRIALQADAQGNISTVGLAERLGVYGFANPYGLTSENNSCFLPSANSGEATLLEEGGVGAGGYKLMQGALEFSSVDLAGEMINVINSQRAYQMNARVVQTADNIADLVNNLR